MLSVARITATRAITKTCPRAAAASVGSRNMVGFADSMKSKVRLKTETNDGCFGFVERVTPERST